VDGKLNIVAHLFSSYTYIKSLKYPSLKLGLNSGKKTLYIV